MTGAIQTTGSIHYETLPSGNVSAITRIKGRDGKYTRVRRTGANKKQARLALEAALDELRAKAPSRPGVPTVAEIVELYYAHQIKQNRWTDNTVETYRSTKNGLLIPKIGYLPIDELTTPEINMLLLEVHNATPGRVKTLKALIRGMCTYAISYGHMQSPNPARDTESFAPAKKEDEDGDGGIRILLPHELERLREVAARYDRAEYRTSGRYSMVAVSPIIELGLAIAGRIGEVLALRWSDVVGLDEPSPDGVATVLVSKTISRTSRDKAKHQGREIEGSSHVKKGTKNGIIREVVLGPATVELLRSLPRTSEFIVPNLVGGHQSHSNFMRRFRVVLDKAELRGDENVKDVSFHALRRTIATRVASSSGVEAGAAAIGDDPVVAAKHYMKRTKRVDFTEFVP